ncbi:MAG: F0F1 ATP synthase subunit B [Clostridia bacterium]|jgi:F-type H+-transporting ATPase subunit b|nr:F0F1 ATP synthase subunit B [Clostridia bacterium]MBQ9130362.1 F0F1 ATP synthase subunit B [Clostridia bacterium]
MIEQIILSDSVSLLNFPVIRIDLWTIIISLGNLLILFLLVKKFLFKPVQKIFDQRKAEVDEVYKEANDAKVAAEADKKYYEERRADAQVEADAIVKKATDQAKRTGEEIVDEAKAEAKALKDKAEREIAQEKTKAINEAKDEIASISVQIAEKIVNRELNEKDQEQFVNRFVDELGENE